MVFHLFFVLWLKELTISVPLTVSIIECYIVLTTNQTTKKLCTCLLKTFNLFVLKLKYAVIFTCFYCILLIFCHTTYFHTFLLYFINILSHNINSLHTCEIDFIQTNLIKNSCKHVQ